MRNKSKIKHLLGLTIALAIPFSSAAAEEIVIFSDGYASVEDSTNILKVGDFVNAVVTDAEVDFLDPDSLTGQNSSDIVYYGTTEVLDGNTFKVEFIPEKTGYYTVYVGSKAFGDAKKYQVFYIDKSDFTETATALLSAKTDKEFADIMAEKMTELGLVDEVFKVADTEETAAIVRKSLSGVGAAEYKKIIEVFKKSAVAALINKGEIKNISIYAEEVGLDENNYFGEDISADVTVYALNKKISSCDEFDVVLKEGMVVATVNKKSASAALRILNDYADVLGIDKDKITEDMCQSLSKGSYTSLDGIKSFIEDYRETDDGQNGGSGSFGGGGGGGSSYSGSTAVKPAEDNKKPQLDNPFTDMEDCQWAIESVKNLYYKSILNGKEEGKFCPNDMVTREEFAKIITSAVKMNLVDEDVPFRDIKRDAWYASYVKSAYIAGITKGISEYEFGIGRNITREDLCVMVCRAVEAGDFELNTSGEMITFVDDAEISDYARDAVDKLVKAGIINGYDGKFNPKASATRAEAAKIINMVMDNVGL